MSGLILLHPVAVADSGTTVFGHDLTNVVGDRVTSLTDGSDAAFHWVEPGHVSASGAGGRVCWIFSVPDIDLPAGARIEWVRPGIRYRFEPAVSTTYGFIAVYIGPTPDQLQVAPLRAAWTIGYRDAGVTKDLGGPMIAKMRTGGSSATALAGSETDWTEEAVNNSCIAAYLFAPDGSANIDLVELYMTVSYRRRGYVDNIAPADGSTITTSQPVISWQPHAPDNVANPQAEYVVRVYSEEQYTRPGFDPWNPVRFPATWQANARNTLTRSVKVTARLKDGIRYRAFIFVRQPWPGTAGRWWSSKPNTTTYGGLGDPYYVEFVVDLPPLPNPEISGTAYSDIAAVRLVTGANYVPGVADDVVYEIERSSDDGETWTAMRGTPVSVPAAPNSIELWDYEAPRGVPLLYQIRATTDTQASDWVIESVIPIEITGTLLKDPLDPSLNRQVTMLAPFVPKRRRPQSNFDVLGREDPVTSSDGFKGWEGSSTIQTDGVAEYEAVDQLLASGRVLLLQDPIGRQWYIEVGDNTEHGELRAVASADEPQFPVRHLNRLTFPWRSAEAP